MNDILDSLDSDTMPTNNESVFCRLLKTDLYRRDWAAEGAAE